MNSVKSQKKRKKLSKWTVADIEDESLKILENKKFIENEASSLMAAAVRDERRQNLRFTDSGGIFVKQKKRKLKEQNSSRVKISKLQSLKKNVVNNIINETMESGKDIDVITHMNDDPNEESKDIANEIDDKNEIIEEQNKTTMKTKMKNDASDDNDENDIDNIMDKILHSDSESVISNLDEDETKSSVADFQKCSCSCFDKEMETYQFFMYYIQDDHRCIVQIPRFTKFYFEGTLKITLLYGGIKVFGYALESDQNKDQTLELYSPRRCMQICITSTGPLCPDTTILEKILSKYKLWEFSSKKLVSNFNVFDCLILIERLFDKHMSILNHYCDNDLFLQKEIILKGSQEERNLGCFLNKLDVYGRRGFTQDHLWSNIKPEQCTVVCGGKGVGKSTLLKFLINFKLRRTTEVLCIDLDPGQNEFTMPGCVTAVIRNKPLLGPNFTNITPPARMAFIGHVNVALDPVKYMKAINYIVQSCREDPYLSQLPWFVNTMGFSKGIGLDIMINIIKLIQPDKLVQIRSSDKARNYEIKLSPELVQNHPVLSLVPVQNGKLKYDLHSFNSCSKTKGIGFQGGYTPAQLRDFMIISYFADAISFPYCSLNAVKPFWIHFSKVYIAVNAVIQPNNILKAINGNLVGLCNLDGVDCTAKVVATTDGNNCFLKLAIQPEIAPCLGCGLVRGIDVKEEKIYIITPIPSEDLRKVNCLCLGNISVPPEFYMKQKYINSPPVYMDVLGARNVRSIKTQFKYYPLLPKNRTN